MKIENIISACPYPDDGSSNIERRSWIEGANAIADALSSIPDFDGIRIGLNMQAPFTQEQVDEFNKRQEDPLRHPWTCCSEGPADKCERRLNTGEGLMKATTDGLVCPCGEAEVQKWMR